MSDTEVKEENILKMPDLPALPEEEQGEELDMLIKSYESHIEHYKLEIRKAAALVRAHKQVFDSIASLCYGALAKNHPKGVLKKTFGNIKRMAESTYDVTGDRLWADLEENLKKQNKEFGEEIKSESK